MERQLLESLCKIILVEPKRLGYFLHSESVNNQQRQKVKSETTGNPKCEYANDGERITRLGKFEGEPIFAPYFWNLALEGFADSDDGKVFTFRLQMSGQDASNPFAPEIRKWLGRKRTLKLYEDSQGFVHCV